MTGLPVSLTAGNQFYRFDGSDTFDCGTNTRSLITGIVIEPAAAREIWFHPELPAGSLPRDLVPGAKQGSKFQRNSALRLLN